MKHEVVDTLTEAERDEIQRLHYRKMTLQTLFRSLSEEKQPLNQELYEKMMEDMIETQAKYDAWFREKAQQRNWTSVDGKHWAIDFQTGDVSLT